MDEKENIFIRCAFDKKSIKVAGGQANGYDLSEIIEIVGTDEFVVVPLYSPRRPLGVIIADNYVTRRPISDGHVSALELFSRPATAQRQRVALGRVLAWLVCLGIMEDATEKNDQQRRDATLFASRRIASIAASIPYLG